MLKIDQVRVCLGTYLYIISQIRIKGRDIGGTIAPAIGIQESLFSKPLIKAVQSRKKFLNQ